jgi:hypothetical protein
VGWIWIRSLMFSNCNGGMMVFWIVLNYVDIQLFQKTCSLGVSWIFSAVRNFPWRPIPGGTWMDCWPGHEDHKD